MIESKRHHGAHLNKRHFDIQLITGVAFLILAVGLTSVPQHARAATSKVINADASFPEGPTWSNGKLYYVEYGRNQITVWDGTTNRRFSSDPGCGQSAIAPTFRGEFLTTCYDNGSIGRITADGSLLTPYTHDQAGNSFTGPNDLAADPHGGMYFTASGTRGAAIDAKVFYIAPDARISQVAENLHNANGIALSSDGHTLYVVETDDNRVLQFKIAADGSLSDRRIFVNLDDLTAHVTHIWPDGVKVSSKNEIYIGQSPRDLHAPLLGTLFILNARGTLLRTLTLPSPKVPNLAFSPDEKTLYVTAVDQIDQPPYRGKVYAVANE